MSEALKNNKSVLFLGCGQLGLACGMELRQQGMVTTGACRNPAKLPDWMRGIGLDYSRPETLSQLAGEAPDILIFTPVPTAYTEEGYRQGFERAMAGILRGLGQQRPLLTVMVSSTRVYAPSEGAWVDEASPLALNDPRAVAIIEAESLLMDSGLPAAVVRFGGIYGDPKGRLLNRIASGSIRGPEPLVYTNRIHRADAAGFLAYLALKAASGNALTGFYTGVDNDPAPRHEVESWLAAELGIDAEQMQPEADAPGHKRCSNQSLSDTGYRLRYPDYRVGYREVLSRRTE